jgi:hypothetical protein
VWFLTFYGQAGVVLPFNMKSYPMFNGLVGFEINPWEIFSINLQMNIKTSPVSAYAFPQTNILAGFIFKFKDFRWQFYLEEDAISNEGADLTVNVMFSHSINLKRSS